jgi:2-polyprenyl-3-methyl-5-hydroxy-6-metoxy-1,4-benzoquinol methylase
VGPDLAARYQLGPQFLAEWAATGGMSLEQLAEADPGSLDGTWADFVLTSNLRGIELAGVVAAHLTDGQPTLRGRRTLDVGAGCGGAIVGCARMGASATGIEPDPRLLALAVANCADAGPGPDVEAGDLLDPGLAERLGVFDAVTANDVLEHVTDAEAGVHALGSLVADGGIVVATIPNGDAVGFVAADGHYLLPGLTVLRHRPDAVAYHSARYPDQTYDVGNYHSYDEYASWFAAAGLTLLDVEHIEDSEVRDLAVDLADAEHAVQSAIGDDGLPSGVRRALEAGWITYLERVDAARKLSPVEAQRRLTARFWRIVASRGKVARIGHHRGRVALRRAAKGIPGLRSLVRKTRGRSR